MNAGLLRLIAAQICLHAAMTGTRLAAPLLALRDGHSAAAVGVLLSLFALTQVFLALPAGRYTDRHGLRRPLLIAVVAATTGAAMAALLPVFIVLCVAALLTGGATGIAVIALQRHVGRAATDPTQLKQVFSWLAIAPAAANFVGPFATGLLIDHAGRSEGDLMGYRVAFGMCALLPLACWWLARGTSELPPVPSTASAARPRAWDLLAQPMFRRLLFVNWLQSASWDVHTFVLPLLGHERGLSASMIGGILGAFAAAAAAIRVVLPVVASRFSERAVITASNVITALVFAAYPLMTSALGMGVCSVMLGVALGAVQPMVMSMLHQITPHARHGEALGLRLMTLNASSVATPMLFGAGGALIGVAGMFWIVSGVVALGTRSVWGLQVPAAGHQSL
ncbi:MULTISPECIES: MFS transporter [unclassified Variovorax]|uniref:MFS transporter n=1 Tax=unclassified Variovorax TaxID=663243 RepID=UPI00131612CD|nr:MULTISPECIES: MFS transporter [unclassified Variovorax]VTU16070.1 multidrug resistance protein [Variovorax sp. SRS16]VTU24294.1 multidrug resistance protein [Variovorax sp. PBL-E5]